MHPQIPRTALQLRSLVRRSGELEVSLSEVDVPEPAADEVLVRIEATPINPSDLGLLFGAADMSSAKVSGSAERPVVSARIPDKSMKAMAGRLEVSMPVGNEGAGVVVKAGASAAAQKLRERVAAELKTTFASSYSNEVSLAGALQLQAIAVYGKRATGAKYLINPNQGIAA